MTALQTVQGMVRVRTGTWYVDPVHSNVGFEAKHMMITTVRGHFSFFEGTLEADGNPAHARVRGAVQVISVETGDTGRDEHLRSADFFDAVRFPEMSFQSSAVEYLDGGTYKVTGDLTIKDITREIEVDATVEGTGEDPWGNQRVGIAVRGEIDRTDFGLNFQQISPAARCSSANGCASASTSPRSKPADRAGVQAARWRGPNSARGADRTPAASWAIPSAFRPHCSAVLPSSSPRRFSRLPHEMPQPQREPAVQTGRLRRSTTPGTRPTRLTRRSRVSCRRRAPHR